MSCLMPQPSLQNSSDTVAERISVFWFGMQFNSTHNFTQSGWLILFNLDLFSGQQKLGKLPNKVSIRLNNTVQCRHLTGGSSIAAAAAAWTHEGTYLIYGFLVSISLRPRDPSWIWIRYIQYATHRNNFTSPPKLVMSIAMANPTQIPSPYFTSGPYFHETTRNNQKHKLTVTPKFISSNGKHDFCYILRTYFPYTSNNTRCYLNFLITPFRLFTSFHFHEACSTKAN